ncbi:MAG: heme o synthase [Phycisphaerales bacterium]
MSQTAPSTSLTPDLGALEPRAIPRSRRHRDSTATGLPALWETTKPGITRLVTMTSLAGFVLAALQREKWAFADLSVSLTACAVGTALSAAGANALNQWMEQARDARMARTQGRPLPTQRVKQSQVLAFGAALCIAGLAVLWALCGPVPMLVSLACIVSYLAVYTPMKPASPLATFVGALPGALPPMIGSAAASTASGWNVLREPAGYALFTLMFVWQIPHFLAIAWMYRDDYARGGYAVLPVVDTTGAGTAWTMALWTAALLPATLLPAVLLPDLLGAPYATVAGVSGLLFAVFAVRLLLEKSRERARQLFFGSIVHLPLLLIAMMAEAIVRGLQ